MFFDPWTTGRMVEHHRTELLLAGPAGPAREGTIDRRHRAARVALTRRVGQVLIVAGQRLARAEAPRSPAMAGDCPPAH